MPKLIRLYVRSILIGFGLAGVFVALLIGFDVAGLRHLVVKTEMGWLGGIMLLIFNGIVFAGVQFGIAIMRMAEDDHHDPHGGMRQDWPDAMRLIEVRAHSPRR